MLALQAYRINPRKILDRLSDFEKYCLGEKAMTIKEFMDLNVELSFGAVLNIGKRRFVKDIDGKHLFWTGLDGNEYDLGTINNINVERDYPGFHRTRTLALGHEDVVKNDTMEVPKLNRKICVVTLKSGKVGIGPNYKIALRNAALKTHIMH